MDRGPERVAGAVRGRGDQLEAPDRASVRAESPARSTGGGEATEIGRAAGIGPGYVGADAGLSKTLSERARRDRGGLIRRMRRSASSEATPSPPESVSGACTKTVGIGRFLRYPFHGERVPDQESDTRRVGTGPEPADPVGAPRGPTLSLCTPVLKLAARCNMPIDYYRDSRPVTTLQSSASPPPA